MSSPVRLQRPSNLALDAPKPKSRVTFKEETLTSQTHSTSNASSSPRKFRYDADFRAKRKRAHSCSFSWDHLSSKRRKSSGTIVLPTKFLLGGSITDPLNLEALDKGDANKNNEEPIGGGCRRGGTVRVIIPPNINDPLNLDACSEDGEEQLADAISRQRRRRKTRKRKRRNSEPGGTNYESEGSKRLCTSLDESHTPRDTLSFHSSTIRLPSTTKDSVTSSTTVTPSTPVTPITASTTTTSAAAPPLFHRGISDPGIVFNPNEESSLVNSSAQTVISATPRHPPQKKQRTKPENKIVSPVVPQPGVERKRHCSYQRHPSSDKPPNPSQSHLHPPKHFHPKNSFFQYGNYNQYYGYRNLGHKTDPRLKSFKKEWFSGKEVLDIGCNIGHITLSIGRDFGPQRIIGVDIDKKLVNIARKNVKHYLGEAHEAEDEFPSSMKLLYGPLKPPVDKGGQRKFPHNVKFYQSNYVLENDALLETVRPEFDVVLCLSVTKWIHLNWGDEGLKRFFRRIFRNLRPGGMLILEPQAWPSYTKKRKLTKEIFENYKNIRLFPNKFGEFLTSEVGFSFVKKGSASQNYSKGFDRPIYIYKKPSLSPEKSPMKEICSTREEAGKSSERDQLRKMTVDNLSSTSSSLPSVESALSSLSSGSNQATENTRRVPVSFPDTSAKETVTVDLPKIPVASVTTSPATESPTANILETPSVSSLPKTSSDSLTALASADLTKSPTADLPKLPSADLPEVPVADIPTTSNLLECANSPKTPSIDSLGTPAASLPGKVSVVDPEDLPSNRPFSESSTHSFNVNSAEKTEVSNVR